jgi:hypothetical protein
METDMPIIIDWRGQAVCAFDFSLGNMGANRLVEILVLTADLLIAALRMFKTVK